MTNFTITEKGFIAFTKNLDYSTLEFLVLSNNKAFNLAFDIWEKFDAQARVNPNAIASEWDYFNSLSGALQI